MHFSLGKGIDFFFISFLAMIKNPMGFTIKSDVQFAKVHVPC